jgi:hypothetical protein
VSWSLDAWRAAVEVLPQGPEGSRKERDTTSPAIPLRSSAAPPRGAGLDEQECLRDKTEPPSALLDTRLEAV